jgi:hypothetical protein
MFAPAPEAPAGAGWPRRGARFRNLCGGTLGGALLIAALAAPVLFYRLGEEEVSGTICERVAITAREMWRTGEWVLPRLNGELRLQKPPLAYWLPGAFATLRGEFDDLTLRLPFALASLSAVLFTFLAARLLLGTEGGLLAAIVLLTSELFMRESHGASADVVLLFTVAGAWWAYLQGRAGAGAMPSEGRPALRWPRVVFYAFVGLGVLAKGPVVIVATVVPPLVEAVATRSREPVRVLWSPTGIALFLVLGLAWPALVILRLGDGAPAALCLILAVLFAAGPPASAWAREAVGDDVWRALDEAFASTPGSLVLAGAIVFGGVVLVWRLLRSDRAFLPYLAVAAAAAAFMAPYRDIKLAARSREGVRAGAESVSALLGLEVPLHAVGGDLGALPAGTAYYLDRPLHFVGEEPARISALPAGSALLASEEHVRVLEGLDGYRLVFALNPGARRERERFLLLEKPAVASGERRTSGGTP